MLWPSMVWMGMCAFSVPAMAQASVPVPVAEVGVQYAYNSLLTSASGESNQSGASIYGQYFFKRTGQRWDGRYMGSVVAQFSGSGSNSGSLYTLLLAPRFNIEWRKSHVVMWGEPFFEAGAAHVRVNGVSAAGPNLSPARYSFAWGIGAGLDLVVRQHYVVTLCQGDSVFLEVPDITSGSSRWRGETRLSGGIGYRFGQR